MPRPRGSKARDPAEGRAEVLAALEAVDLVVVFEEDTPHELIKRGRPAVLVKGGQLSHRRPPNHAGRPVERGPVHPTIWPQYCLVE
jgi:hypothetical protein